MHSSPSRSGAHCESAINYEQPNASCGKRVNSSCLGMSTVVALVARGQLDHQSSTNHSGYQPDILKCQTDGRCANSQCMKVFQNCRPVALTLERMRSIQNRVFVPPRILTKHACARGQSSKTQCVVAAGSDHRVERRRFFLRVGAAAVVPTRPL